MDLNVNECKHDPEINIISMSGRLDVETSERISPEVLLSIEQCSAGVILDMADVVFVSSAGLRVLLNTYKKAIAADKKIAMIQPQPQVYKIFKVAAFDTMFNICKNEKEALNLFAGSVK